MNITILQFKFYNISILKTAMSNRKFILLSDEKKVCWMKCTRRSVLVISEILSWIMLHRSKSRNVCYHKHKLTLVSNNHGFRQCCCFYVLLFVQNHSILCYLGAMLQKIWIMRSSYTISDLYQYFLGYENTWWMETFFVLLNPF